MFDILEMMDQDGWSLLMRFNQVKMKPPKANKYEYASSGNENWEKCDYTTIQCRESCIKSFNLEYQMKENDRFT